MKSSSVILEWERVSVFQISVSGTISLDNNNHASNKNTTQ